MSNPVHDKAALDAATAVMDLVRGPTLLGGDAQLKACIQCLLIELLKQHGQQPPDSDSATIILAQQLRAEIEQLQAEIERLGGARPDFPPRPPDGEGLPRYGIRWNGPQDPLTVPMEDGYWTPWHLADYLRVANADLNQDVALLNTENDDQLLIVEKLVAENARLIEGLLQILMASRLGDAAFSIAGELIGELDAHIGAKEQQS